MRIIEGRVGGLGPQSSWYCDDCGEWLEPQFTTCWQCGAARPAGPFA